jgi:hypothetical protein
MDSVVPALMENINIANADFRVEAIKIVSDLSLLIFNKQNEIGTDGLRNNFKNLIESQFFDA